MVCLAELDTPYALFPYTERTKDTVQQVVRVDRADNFSQFVQGGTKFYRD
jgi:hypothetical protein